MDKNSQHLQLTEAYRASRRNISLACAITLAWAASQFELKTLSIGSIVTIDLTNATIPLILAAVIAYTFLRCMIEYAMQPILVRQWNLAQADFKLIVFLVRASALALGASGLYRSLDSVFTVAVLALALVILSLVFSFVGIFTITPIMIAIRKPQGRHSIASRVIEADAWSQLIIVVSLCLMFVGLGIASLYYEPIRLLWPAVPSLIAVPMAVLTACAVVISVYLQPMWYRKLFAKPITALALQTPS